MKRFRLKRTRCMVETAYVETETLEQAVARSWDDPDLEWKHEPDSVLRQLHAVDELDADGNVIKSYKE